MRIPFLLLLLLSLSCLAQEDHRLRILYAQGELEFPQVMDLPTAPEASTAPTLTVSDRRDDGVGYRLSLRWEPAELSKGQYALEIQPGVALAFVTPRGAAASSPPLVSRKGGELRPGDEVTILWADRSASQNQGRGDWLVQLNPRAFRLRTSRGLRDGTYLNTLRFVLYASP